MYYKIPSASTANTDENKCFKNVTRPDFSFPSSSCSILNDVTPNIETQSIESQNTALPNVTIITMDIASFGKDEEDTDYCPSTDDSSSDGCSDPMEIDPEEENIIMIYHRDLTCTNSSG